MTRRDSLSVKAVHEPEDRVAVDTGHALRRADRRTLGEGADGGDLLLGLDAIQGSNAIRQIEVVEGIFSTTVFPMKRGRGRPALPDGESRTVTLVVRLRPSELKAIEALAAAERSVSSWARLKS